MTSVVFDIAQRAIEGQPKVQGSARRTEQVVNQELRFLFELSKRVGRVTLPCEIDVEIEYEPRFREVEARRVIVRNFFMFSNEIYIDSFCHLRGRTRTFQLNRIRGLKSSGELKFKRTDQMSELIGCLTAPNVDEALDETDFFVHSRTWGDYKRPCSIILRKMMDTSFPKDRRFDLLFGFTSTSLKHSVWTDYYKDSKAAGVALLALRTDLKRYDWMVEAERMRGGRFDKSAFRRTLASIG